MRQMIRSLKQDSQQDKNNKKINDFLTSSGSPDAAEEETAPKPTYNYKEVASKIQSAKTRKNNLRNKFQNIVSFITHDAFSFFDLSSNSGTRKLCS